MHTLDPTQRNFDQITFAWVFQTLGGMGATYTHQPPDQGCGFDDPRVVGDVCRDSFRACLDSAAPRNEVGNVGAISAAGIVRDCSLQILGCRCRNAGLCGDREWIFSRYRLDCRL